MGTRSPEFLLSFLRDSGNRIVFLAGKLRFSQFTTLRQKAASYLLDCVRKQRTETVALEHSREALAELFGATRPSVSRAFSGLRDDGLIQLDGRTVYILSMGGLKKVVSAVCTGVFPGSPAGSPFPSRSSQVLPGAPFHETPGIEDFRARVLRLVELEHHPFRVGGTGV